MRVHLHQTDLPIRDLDVSAPTIPTDLPKSDGTLEWDTTNDHDQDRGRRGDGR